MYVMVPTFIVGFDIHTVQPAGMKKGLSLMAYTNNSMCGQELASFPGSPTPEHEYVYTGRAWYLS